MSYTFPMHVGLNKEASHFLNDTVVYWKTPTWEWKGRLKIFLFSLFLWLWLVRGKTYPFTCLFFERDVFNGIWRKFWFDLSECCYISQCWIEKLMESSRAFQWMVMSVGFDKLKLFGQILCATFCDRSHTISHLKSQNPKIRTSSKIPFKAWNKWLQCSNFLRDNHLIAMLEISGYHVAICYRNYTNCYPIPTLLTSKIATTSSGVPNF
jgi:hypothetical protein